MLDSYNADTPRRPLTPAATEPKFDEPRTLGSQMPNMAGGFTSALPVDHAQASVSTFSFGRDWFKH